MYSRSKLTPETIKPPKKFEFGALVSIKGHNKHNELINSNGRVVGCEWGGNNYKLGQKDCWFYYVRPAESNAGAPGVWVSEDQLEQIT